MRRSSSFAVAIAAAPVLAASLLGPAAGASSAAQLVARCKQALAAARTFTANGFAAEPGGRVGFVVRSTDNGAVAAGTITSTSKSIGYVGSASFVRIGSAFYLKGNRSFWTSELAGATSASLLAALANRWIILPSADVKAIATSMGRFTNAARLAALIATPSASDPYVLEGKTFVHDHAVLLVRSTHSSLFVAGSGSPLPYEYTTAAGTDKASIAFTYPVSEHIVAPPGAKTPAQIVQSLATTTTTLAVTTTTGATSTGTVAGG